MKTSRWAAYAAAGAALAWLGQMILLAIAVPRYGNLLIPEALGPELTPLAGLSGLFGDFTWLWLALALAASLWAWAEAAAQAHPAMPDFPYRSASDPLWAWAYFTFSWALALTSLWLFAGVLLSGFADIIDVKFGATTAARCAAGAALLGLSWWTLHRTRRDGALPLGPGRSSLKAFARTAGLGAAFGLALAACAQWFSRFFFFLLAIVADIWTPAPETTATGLKLLLSIATALGALLAAGGLGLSGAFTPEALSPRRRWLAARPAAALLAIAALLCGALRWRAERRYDWGAKDLSEAAGLAAPEGSGQPLALVWFSYKDGKAAAHSDSWPLPASYDGSLSHKGGEIAATDANAERLIAFAADPENRSRFRNAALTAALGAHTARWDQDGARAAFEKAVSLGLSTRLGLLSHMVQAAWLTHTAPLTGGNRRRIEEFCEGKGYERNARWAAECAWGLARLGRREPSARMGERARELGADPWLLKRLEGLDALARGALLTGRVRGRVKVSGPASPPVTVGLFLLSEGSFEARPSPRARVLFNLAASRRAGRDGSFSFENLSAGRYALAFLVEAPPGLAVKASPAPPLLALSRAKPRADAGTVVLRF